MPVKGVVFDGDFRVGGDDLAVGSKRHRVDLDHLCVALVIGLDHGSDQLGDSSPCRNRNVRRGDERTQLIVPDSPCRVDVGACDGVRVCCGDLFDVHPTLGREHHDVLLSVAVEQNGQVILFRNVHRLGDQHPLDDHPRRVLNAHEPLADQVAHELGSRIGVLEQLDPARFATAPIRTWAFTTTRPPRF